MSDILDVLANDNELLKKEIETLETKTQRLEQEHIILLELNQKSRRIVHGSLNNPDDLDSNNFGSDANEEIVLIKLLY